MASVLSQGETVLENCAMEPDIIDLGQFLIKMGANIKGLGTETIIINGVNKLNPVKYSIMPDRIEAGTYLLAGAITRGKIKIKNIVPEHIEALTNNLSEIGFKIEKNENSVSIEPARKLQGCVVKTMPYPGFPTDLQAPMMALMTTIPGVSVIIETIFEKRYTHIAELRRMSADITLEGDVAIIKGVKKLTSATVMMSDLRAGAALVLAALASDNESEIRRIYHCDRGYEKLSEKLSGLGADIKRVKGEM
jgi:UDP-N-acetylglucosamine 1-carboxyvinyltransferase